MTELTKRQIKRSYGCSYGCGNPFDFMVVSNKDLSTLALCTPCFIQTAAQMLEAMTNPENSEVVRMLREAGDVDQVPFEDEEFEGKTRHAPVELDDPDAIAAFEGEVPYDELPDEFK